MNEPVFFRLDVEILEDLHTGTGTGSGDIDALVARDRNGCPVVRASHLKGLLREAGEELVRLGDKSVSESALNALLGRGGDGRAALRLTSLRTEDDKTLLWTSSARKENERVPKDDTMRVVEHVAAGTSFAATLRLAGPGHTDLLKRLVRRLDRLGGARNRGSGLVQSSLRECGQLDTTHALPTQARGANVVRLILRNIEPLCLPLTGHPGNLIRSQSFICGQVLRGALISWAIDRGINEDALLAGRVGDALPLPSDLRQAESVLPIPMSLLTEKPSGKADIPWWDVDAASPMTYDSLVDVTKPKEKAKRPGADEYLCRANKEDLWRRYEPGMTVHLRNQTADRDTPETVLFSMEEISEDTRFQADIVFDDPEFAKRFLTSCNDLLSGADWLAIGRAGQPVFVEAATTLDDVKKPPSAGADCLTLTLTSDLIVRGLTLGFLDNLDEAVLARLIGMDNKVTGDIKITKAIAETEVLQGFNAASGLRRAPAVTIRRGSCWRIEGADSAACASKLADLPAMGERTDEGCGRFKIDLHPLGKLATDVPLQSRPDENAGESLLKTAKTLADLPGARAPSASQLQWLRGRALAAADEGQIRKLIDELRDAPKRRPTGGKVWEKFPFGELSTKIAELASLQEKRLLISHVVRYALTQKTKQQNVSGKGRKA